MTTPEQERKEKLQSLAKPLRTAITKQKKLGKAYYKATDFDGPILELMRINGKTDLYEKATKGEFHFKHTNGEKKKILLDPLQSYTVRYLNNNTKKYFCHEDYALPLPHNALLTVDVLTSHETQVLASASEFATKLEKAKALTLKQWAGMLTVVVIGIILYTILKPEDAPTITQAAGNAVRGNFSLG